MFLEHQQSALHPVLCALDDEYLIAQGLATAAEADAFFSAVPITQDDDVVEPVSADLQDMLA